MLDLHVGMMQNRVKYFLKDVYLLPSDHQKNLSVPVELNLQNDTVRFICLSKKKKKVLQLTSLIKVDKLICLVGSLVLFSIHMK